MSVKTRIRLGAGIAALAFLLAGCSGGADASGDAGDVAAGVGEGFEYGADQSEVDTLIEDLEPVTLTFQAGAGSPNSTSAAKDLAFEEYIETRSNGKIQLEIAWGQAIAAHSEVLDALNDGRLDMAYYAAIYFPEEFPTTNAYSATTQYSTAAPLTGEAISTAMMAEFGWNSEEHIQLIEDNGLVALSPLMASGDYWAACNAPVPEIEDWQGLQVRIGSAAQIEIMGMLGANGVSMEFNEVYEAAQRGTVDCTLVQPAVAGNTGVIEATPHVYHLADQRMTGSATASNLAGPSFKELPLAYQQIIFDAEAAHLHGTMLGNLDGGHQAVLDAKANGGQFQPIDPETEGVIVEAQEAIVDEHIEDGRLQDSIREDMENLAEKWSGITEELGYTDDGNWGDFDEWYEPGTVDFQPLTDRVMLEAALPHRPSN